MKKAKLTPVFEVYGKTAEENGWDCVVCQSLESALTRLSFDLDSLEDGQEVKVVLKMYTESDMDDIYS